MNHTETEGASLQGDLVGEKDDGVIDYKDKWENIGYHRVLGSFFWNIIFAILAVAYMLILPILIPYPESMGFYNILTGIFASIFTFADLGLASALSRFIAEHRVKNPARCIEYVRFFIWFQAFTGLGQTTIISLIGLYALGGSTLSYMPWLFMWLSTIQYPGYLSVFNEALKGFQQYGKVSLIGVLNQIFFQVVTLAIGAQLGAYFGDLNPEIGGVMGASIGMIIGYYVDDFSTIILSGWMFSKVLKPMGFRIRDVFVPKVRKEIALESVKFGMGVMLFVLSYTIVGTIVAFVYANFLPNYSTFIGSLSILAPIIGLAETVNGIHIGNHRSTVSEAYFNDKKNYAVYVLSNGFRTVGQVTFLMTPIVLLIGPAIIENLFPGYINVFYMIFIPKLIFSCVFQHSHLMNEVLIGTGNHKFNVIITVIEQVVNLILVIICINLQLGIYVLIIPGFFQTAVKQGIGWLYINFRIINLKFNPWQNWGATAISGVIYFFFLAGIHQLLILFVAPFASYVVVLIVMVLLSIYLLPGIGYFLPLALVGGYDKHTLEDLKKAVELSGPSKAIVTLWYKGAAFGAKISPLHGKVPMTYQNVGEEIEELMRMKKEADTTHEKIKGTAGFKG